MVFLNNIWFGKIFYGMAYLFVFVFIAGGNLYFGYRIINNLLGLIRKLRQGRQSASAQEVGLADADRHDDYWTWLFGPNVTQIWLGNLRPYPSVSLWRSPAPGHPRCTMPLAGLVGERGAGADSS